MSKSFLQKCERYCEKCDIPVCALCLSSKEHQAHDIVEISKSLVGRKHSLQRDLQNLEKFIYPKYRKIESNILVQKDELNENSEKFITSINKHGDDLHREIQIIIQHLTTDRLKMDSNHLDVLNKQEYKIMRTICEITQNIVDLKTLLESSDASLVSAYKSRTAEFSRLSQQRTALSTVWFSVSAFHQNGRTWLHNGFSLC